jgi:lysophospholipase L1-like esterase
MSRLGLAAVVLFVLALPAGAQARPQRTWYVSLGDSYAQGVQPLGSGQADVPTNEGFTDVLYKGARKLVPGLKLAKLGCGGATTGSMVEGTRPCPIDRMPYRSTSRATSQLAYAGRFLRAHRGHIAFVSLSIGGNDIDSCAGAGDLQQVAECVVNGIAQIKRNLPVIARTLRRAAGPTTPIFGSTYPNVVLGEWLQGDTGKTLATASVAVLRDQFNPTLKKVYAKQRIGFIDATTAFGGYIPFTQTTALGPFGQVPVAVANICTLSWFCTPRSQGPDIHLRPAGYAKLATLYFDKLKRRLR